MNLPELLNRARIACKARDDASLARCLGVTKGAVSNWRNGQRFPDWRACERIVEKTGIPLDVVLAAVAAARRGEDGLAGGDAPAEDQLPLPGFRHATA